MLVVLKVINLIEEMFCRICWVVIKLFLVLCGRLIWEMLLLMIILELKFNWVKNIFIWVLVVFCVLFKIIKVLFKVCLCM